jgi:hypothetical protein
VSGKPGTGQSTGSAFLQPHHPVKVRRVRLLPRGRVAPTSPRRGLGGSASSGRPVSRSFLRIPIDSYSQARLNPECGHCRHPIAANAATCSTPPEWGRAPYRQAAAADFICSGDSNYGRNVELSLIERSFPKPPCTEREPSDTDSRHRRRCCRGCGSGRGRAHTPSLGGPNLHVPDGSANWCPGGRHPGYGRIRYCNGKSFLDGTFYTEIWHFGTGGPFAAGSWNGSAMCSQWTERSIQGAFAGGCGSGPQAINF